MAGMKKPFLPALLGALIPLASHAVYLNPEGDGEALIYPYYTVQSANGNAFNTYLSIVAGGPDGKALRLYVREGRAGKAVVSVNLYLAPGDMWTGAIVPGAGPNDPPKLISNDKGCADPNVPPEGLALDNRSFTGTRDDGNGTDADRLREGFVEVLEMGALSAGFSFDAQARNCFRFAGAVDVTAPTGRVRGTVTLINVANGTDFAVAATALAQLASQPFFRAASDPYPDFDAVQIDPWSLVVSGGTAYRSIWSRPVDAVSAALMTPTLGGEYVLDTGTRSSSEMVMTFPTRRFYVGATPTPPFTSAGRWDPRCGSFDSLGLVYRNREGAMPVPQDSSLPTSIPFATCSATLARTFRASGTIANSDGSSRIFGSRLRDASFDRALDTGFVNGSFSVAAAGTNAGGPRGLHSLPESQRIDLASGVATTHAHEHDGLPMIGFWVRTFENGTLSCDVGRCQGNYGAAFPSTRTPYVVDAP